jgi:hypothetical protein
VFDRLRQVERSLAPMVGATVAAGSASRLAAKIRQLPWTAPAPACRPASRLRRARRPSGCVRGSRLAVGANAKRWVRVALITSPATTSKWRSSWRCRLRTYPPSRPTTTALRGGVVVRASCFGCCPRFVPLGGNSDSPYRLKSARAGTCGAVVVWFQH